MTYYTIEVLLGIRLLGTTFWRGLSNYQAATARMGTWQAQFSLRINKYRRVPTPIRSTSSFSEPGAGVALEDVAVRVAEAWPHLTDEIGPPRPQLEPQITSFETCVRLAKVY